MKRDIVNYTIISTKIRVRINVGIVITSYSIHYTKLYERNPLNLSERSIDPDSSGLKHSGNPVLAGLQGTLMKSITHNF